jgi:hypothetical protein
MAKKAKREGFAMPVTNPRISPPPPPATAPPVANGPTTGYRDGKDGVVETADFMDGRLPKGWHDSPAKCKNCDGVEHMEYVKVKPGA